MSVIADMNSSDIEKKPLFEFFWLESFFFFFKYYLMSPDPKTTPLKIIIIIGVRLKMCNNVEIGCFSFFFYDDDDDDNIISSHGCLVFIKNLTFL